MKKVKTFLASLMIILGAAVLTACSCSGGGDETDYGPQIPVSNISITSDFSKAVREEETGYLIIVCSQGDKFNITYNLSPDNTTRTQVEWDFEGDDSVLKVDKNYYTYSQGVTHTITFEAKREGEATIKFKPKNTDKWTQANVTVGKAQSTWPSFVEPSGLSYNPNTGKVVWKPVSQQKLNTGKIENVKYKSDNTISGLTGYIVHYVKYSVNNGVRQFVEEYTTPENNPISECEYSLPAGYSYEFSVYARGDKFSMKDSPYSTTLKFHQLASVNNLANNNGKISFNTAEYSQKHEVHYLANKNPYIPTSDGAESIEFNAVGQYGKFEEAEKYTISVKSYPENYDRDKVVDTSIATGGDDPISYVLSQSDGYRYYPSAYSEQLVVENLISPSFTILSSAKADVVGGVTFDTTNSSELPYVGTKILWDIISKTYSEDCNVQYQFAISKNDSGDKWTQIYPATGFATGNNVDLEQFQSSATNVQYKISVYASGNPTNTIASKVVDYKFHMLRPMESATITQTDLTTSTANSPLFGIGLYFVNLDDSSHSKYQFFSGKENGIYEQKTMTVNISSLKLMPGRYDIYGRFVGVNNGATEANMAVTSAYAKLNSLEVQVASPVANASIRMSNAGILTFTKVNGIDEYSMTITQSQNGQSYSFLQPIHVNASNSSTTGSVTTVTQNVYDIIQNHLLTLEDVTDENVQEKLKDFTSNSTISITLTSIGLEQVGINSTPSNALKFKRYNVIDVSTIALSDSTATFIKEIDGESKIVTTPSKTLSFESPNNSAIYVIKIGERSFTTTASYNKNDTVQINLGEAVVTTDESGNKTYLLDYINQSGLTNITIWSVGGGATANGSDAGFVDSYAVSKSFNCTSTVTNLTMSDEEVGLLKWKLSSEFTTEQSFYLNFYSKVDGEWQPINNYQNIKINASRESTTTVEGEGEEETSPQSTTLGEYYVYNISDTIEGIEDSQVVAVTVTHIIPDRFTNVASANYYIMQLPQVEITRVLDGSTPSVTFQAEDGITYSLVVTNKSDNSEVINTTYTKGLEQSGTFLIHLSDLGLTDTGDYSISIYAYKSMSGENSESNPYTFSGNLNALDISIVSKEDIVVSANGEYITWNVLHTALTYNVEYQTPAGEWAFIKDGENNKVFTNDGLTYNVWSKFDAGDNKVRITPIVDYVTSGVYIVGNLKETTIKKLNTITANNSTVYDGVIHYTLNDEFTNNDYSLVIKIGNDNLSNVEYTVDKENKTITILSSKYIGQKAYEIQIVYPNTISSDYNTPFNATKVDTVDDIAKEGEWITFTPVTGANIYLLAFSQANGENKVERRIKYDVQDGVASLYMEKVEESTTWESLATTLAKVVEGKIYLNFFAEEFGWDVSNSGIYNFSVTPYAVNVGYLNGNISTNYKIAKLSNSVDMNISGDSFVISNYQRTQDQLQTPQNIAYSIVYSKTITNEYSKGSSWNDVSWEFDTTKFDSNTKVLYTATFSTTEKEYKQTYILSYNGANTPTIQLVVPPEGEETSETYQDVLYLSVTESDTSTSDHKIFKVTLSSSQIISIEVKTALGSEESPVEPSLVTISYAESKVVKEDSLLFSEVNIEGKDENDQDNSYLLNLNTLQLLNDGEYKLVLQFVGDDNQVISSSLAESESYTKLPAPVLQTKEGVLSWNSVADASAYTLKITCDAQGVEGEGEESEITSWDFEDYTFTATEENALPNISEADLKNLNSTFPGFETGRNYYIQIMATSSTKLSSKWSTIFTVQKLQAPTNIAVKSTGNSIINNGDTTYIGEPLVTWSDPNSISNRPNYTMWIGEHEITIDNTGELSGQIIPRSLQAGSYEVSMITIGNDTAGTNKIGLLTSDRSTQNPQVNYVTETTQVSYENNSFTWVPVSGAYTYKLTFYKGTFSSSEQFKTQEKVFTKFATSNSYNFSSTEFEGNGYYTVLINAYCDPNKAIVSTFVEKDDEGNEIAYDCANCSSIYKSPSITNLMVKDGLLSWSIKIDDIKEFLNVHPSIEGDALMTYFAEDISTEGNSATIREELLSAVVDYIKGVINRKVTGDESVNKIISNLYTFKANINGVETVVTPTSVDTINISIVDGKNQYNSIASANDAQYLMFKFDLTNNPMSDDNATANQFVFQVSPKGNYLDSNTSGLITTVDGKFNTSITVYKPQTPTSVNIENIAESEGEGESSTEVSGGTRKQISKGNLYWSLVTTEDSTLENLDYHYKYQITAVDPNSVDTIIPSKYVNVLDTQVNNEGVITNPNLEDNINYHVYLKDLFDIENDIDTNTSYSLKINVMGTEDSTDPENEGKKLYLNSNAFSYTDIMNILSNIDSGKVSGGNYNYTPCSNMSSETKVYVYGPFVDDDNNPIYAPDETDETTWKWENVMVNGHKYNKTCTSYASAVKAWKEIISTIWGNPSEHKWTGDYQDLRHDYTFAEEATSGDNVSVSRQTILSLTGDTSYGAGSYIIRKQEKGNGRGIVDTEFTDILLDGEYNPLELDYEVIATKLGTAQKSVVTELNGEDVSNEIWLEDGKFVWKKVERANAYRILVEKLKKDEQGQYQLVSGGVKNTTMLSKSIAEGGINEYYEMPEETRFNEDGCVYRITITATHVQGDGNTISDNYFEGEDVITDSYGRATIPDALKVNETGVVSWDETVSESSIVGYDLRVNGNMEITTLTSQEKSYDLSNVEYGTFKLSIRAKGKTDGEASYLNSCYNPPVTITKLTNPNLVIAKGQVNWGTATSEGMGEQQTKTKFKLLNENGQIVHEETLNETVGEYILHTEINTFNATYDVANEEYLAGKEYTFAIKYQGTPTTTIMNSSSNRDIKIASNEKTLTATKLAYPTLSSVDVFNNNLSENRIRWSSVDNVSGYRALVITKQNSKNIIYDITEIRAENGYQTTYTIYENDKVLVGPESKYRADTATDDNYYFVYDNVNNKIDLRLSKLIALRNLNTANGLSLDVYVQAIGSTIENPTADDDKYISSSFSARKKVEIPPMPTGISFAGSTGTLSWQTNASAGHNARITMSYVVNNVSATDFAKWQNTADTIKVKNGENSTEVDNSANRYPEIKSRSIEYVTNTANESTTYTLTVYDTVFLNAKNGLTPTSYQVTSIGTEYSFAVRILVGDETYQGLYMSEEAKLTSTTSNPNNFLTFDYGDGSANLPYGIKNSTMFNSIRYYPSANFVVDEDISFYESENDWEVIEEFSGVIEGNNKKVEYLKPSVVTITDDGGDPILYKAIIKENSGTIKNLNISVNNTISQQLTNGRVYLAGLAITNTGTLENVHITTYGTGNHISANITGSLYSTNVAGLVNINQGTISNCSVETTSKIVALDDNMTNYNISTNVAGLVNINSGTIDKSHFSGSLQGNLVGGIANENSGTISNTYSLGKAYVTDAGITSNGKGVTYGGIAGIVYGNATIENCYSRMEAEVDIKTTIEFPLFMGGLVGKVETKTNPLTSTTITNNVTIKNCYVVFTATIVGEAGALNTNQVYALSAPQNTGVTYSNNYYVVNHVENASNITPNNTTGVAANAETLSGLRDSMIAFKDSDNNSIYKYIVEAEDEESSDIQSIYPILVSNPETNVVTSI